MKEWYVETSDKEWGGFKIILRKQINKMQGLVYYKNFVDTCE